MIQGIRGTKDILPASINKWYFVENILDIVSRKFGYNEIRTPIFESTEVFSRSIGELTDIVNKEMYTFMDKGGDSLTLRPEQTAALVRAVIQNSMLQQQSTLRLWYYGPFFRYERPQKGRLRQFHQYGAECIGTPYPESDVEMLLLAHSIIKNLGITDYNLKINSLGNENSRNKYRAELFNYFAAVSNSLSDDSRLRLNTNPLRILDSKDSRDIEFIVNAPRILDYLDDDSREHFNYVTQSLDELNVNYEIQPRLVRGLDYYSHTVFEFQSNILGAQDSFGGGGRYDKLFEQLGGKPTPAVGFAMGIERILLILDALNNSGNQNISPDVYVIILDKDYFNYAYKICTVLRSRQLSVICNLQRRTLKAQLREANKLNVKYAVVIGEDEFKTLSLTIKNMKDSSQHRIEFYNLENYNFS